MQSINFASFKVQKSANERSSLVGVARGQNFKLKFRKFLANKKGSENKTDKIEDTVYTISNDKFKELNLSEYGIVQLIPEDGKAYIATVSNDDATMLKRTDKLKNGAEKGKKFKSTILDKALLDSGIIEDKVGDSQLLDLVEVGENVEIGTILAYKVYEIVKGEDTRSDEEKASDASQDEEKGDDVEGKDETADAAETAAPTETATQTPTDTVDDDF